MNITAEYDISNWKSHIVSLDTGIKMAYYECGPARGPRLMLIHGVTDSRISWMQMAPALAQLGYHCYIVEYRGNGATDHPDCGKSGYTADMIALDILDLMNKIHLTCIHAIGHSYGSLITQELALLAPESFSSYTLIDTCVDCRHNPVILELLNGDGKDFLGVDSYDERMPESFIQEWAATTNEDSVFREATLDNVRNMPMVSWRNLIRGLNQFNNRDIISGITGKVMVIWGTEDNIFTFKDQQDVKLGLTSCDVKYVNVQGASHNGFWDSLENVRKYAQIIDDFIKC